MQPVRTVTTVLFFGVMLSLLACQSLAAHPATLNLDDAKTRTVVTSVLSGAVNRAKIELGPVASSQTGTLTVLPPPLGPLEKNAPGMPVKFNIQSRAGKCQAVQADTQTVYELPGVACTPG